MSGGEWVTLAASIVAAGVLTGILAGVFGIGGGAIIVPVLFEVFRLFGVPEDVRMQLCIGTSLAIIVPTAIRSYRAHKARGLVYAEVLRAWAWPAVAGVVVGSVIAAFAPGSIFKIAFVVMALVIAARLLFGGDKWVIADDLPGPMVMRGYGALLGLCSSLMGVSGGSLATMLLTLHKKPILNGIATASGIGVPITIAGTVGYVLAGLDRHAELPPLSIGFVSLIGVVMIAPISSYVAPLGARIAHTVPKRGLEIAFGLFLILVSARFIVSLV
ncbi:MAG TPA: sulfite exporter TauE/SafE family protein [Stellaceae bacterium]|jgi:uncharacterized membrane protein YfcA